MRTLFCSQSERTFSPFCIVYECHFYPSATSPIAVRNIISLFTVCSIINGIAGLSVINLSLSLKRCKCQTSGRGSEEEASVQGALLPRQGTVTNIIHKWICPGEIKPKWNMWTRMGWIDVNKQCMRWMDVNKHCLSWMDNEKLCALKFVGQTDVSYEPEVLPT